MKRQPNSNAEASLSMCALFESELLVSLMLSYWNHPKANDVDFQSDLLEAATEVLRAAADDVSHVFIEGMPTAEMNLVAAVWYVETQDVANIEHRDCDEVNARKAWLTTVRKVLPSCLPAFVIPRICRKVITSLPWRPTTIRNAGPKARYLATC